MSDPRIRSLFANAALKIAADKSWSNVTLHDLAVGVGKPVFEFYPLTPADAFDCVDEYFDLAAAANLPAPDRATLARDRVFDVCMRRFEAMEDYRKGLLALDKAIERDALALTSAFARHTRTARWLLALAGADEEGVSAAARAQALAFVLRDARRAWAKDDAGDFAKTMAALDKGLRRSDSFFEGVSKMAGGFKPGPAKPGASAQGAQAKQEPPADRPAPSAPG
jgi:hypothetical protein